MHIPFFRHESTIHRFSVFVLFFSCTSSIVFYFLNFYILLENIFNQTKFPQLNMIQSCVRHHVLCLFAFLTVLIWSPTVAFQHFSKCFQRGWLTRCPPWSFTNPVWHSATLCLRWSSHCIFIYSNVHWQLVYLLLDGSMYCLCLLSSSSSESVVLTTAWPH